MAGICAEEGCDRPTRVRGLCTMHYGRLRRAERRDEEADVANNEGADKAPTGKGQKQPKAAKGKGRTPPKAELQSLIATVGLAVWPINAYDGERIMEGSEKLADALYQLAKDNDAVRRALLAAMATSAWGAVAAAIAPILLPILANHGVIGSEMAAMVGAPAPPGSPDTNGHSSSPLAGLSPDGPPDGGAPVNGDGPPTTPSRTPDEPGGESA